MSKLIAYIKSVPDAPVFLLEEADVPMGDQGLPFPVYTALAACAPFERKVNTSAHVDIIPVLQGHVPSWVLWLVRQALPHGLIVKVPFVVGVKVQ